MLYLLDLYKPLKFKIFDACLNIVYKSIITSVSTIINFITLPSSNFLIRILPSKALLKATASCLKNYRSNCFSSIELILLCLNSADSISIFN